MTYEALALLLMAIGFALIVAEVFIPSGGLLSILCVVTFSSSVWSAYKAWYGVSPWLFWTFVAALVILIPLAVVAAFRFLERSAFGRKVLLRGPTQAEVTPHRDEVSRLTALVGQKGQALTLMTPGGMVEVLGERLHAESDGSLISSGTCVEVVGVKGTRVLVRESAPLPAEKQTPPEAPPTTPLPLGSEDDPRAPLDFDFPQG